MWTKLTLRAGHSQVRSAADTQQVTEQRDVSPRHEGAEGGSTSEAAESRPQSATHSRLPINWRTGMMYGAALGMLAGLIWQTISPLESTDSIVRWRNTILAGAALGLLIALTWRLTRKAR